MLKIYHNPRCKKSCEGLKYLQNMKVEFEVVKYIEKGLTPTDLNEILLKLNKRPYEIIRTQEEYFKKELKGKKFNDEEWIKIIIENPKLLQRPIVIGKYKAVVAKPPELMEQIIK
jgi:Arsenate reductase and related proteins, glutaredoxin family